MSKSKAARIAGFVGALGGSAVLVGAAVHSTGAYFTDSQTGQMNSSTGSVKVNTTNTTLNYDNLLPGQFKTRTIGYSNGGSDNEDIYLVWDDGAGSEAITGNPEDGRGGGLGRYGHLRVTAPDGSFVSNNLSNPRPSNPQAKCAIDAYGRGGSEDAANTTADYPKYCAPDKAILLSYNIAPGVYKEVNIEFGFTKLLGNKDGDGHNLQGLPSSKLAGFKIVAVQHGVSINDPNNYLS